MNNLQNEVIFGITQRIDSIAKLNQDQDQLDAVVLGILQLIGLPLRLKAMIGATILKGHFDDQPGIQLKFPASNKINCCQITLDIGKDLYILKFMQIKDLAVINRGIYRDLFAEDVVGIFETVTGLYLSL
jgi:hypothetical protein